MSNKGHDLGEKHRIIQNVLKGQSNLFQNNGKPVYPSNNIWQKISQLLFEKFGITIKPKTLYNDILKKKYNVSTSISTEERREEEKSEFTSFSDDCDESDTENEEIRFTITLSDQEWETIKPINVSYKRGKCDLKEYTVLPPHKWASIIYSHFWNHTKLSCSLTFKKAQVFLYGENFVEIKGHCNECGSIFSSKLEMESNEHRKALFKSSYIGPFRKIVHEKKRPLAGNKRREIATTLLERNMSCSAFRQLKAAELMEFGDAEPAHLPKASVLRVAVNEEKKRKRLAEDVLDAAYVAKYQPPFNAYIKDIGIDKVFIHYWSSTQVHVYNEYCKKMFSKISIDATGGIFKKIKRPDGTNCGAIFLYDVTVNDPQTKSQYSVCNMVSERHDGDSIGYWLRQWIRDGASTPNEVVCDMSLALLSGVAKSFGQIFNITCYVNECYNILFNRQSSNLKTYIRCDVAHVIKLFTSLKSLKGEKRRTRQFYVRVLTKILLSTSIDEVKRIFFALFVVAGSETEGEEDGVTTDCDTYKIWLKDLIAEGFESTDEKIIMDKYLDVNDVCEDIDRTIYDITSDDSLFKDWTLAIYEESKLHCSNNGNRDNMQFLPEIIKDVIYLSKLLPLWSAIMTPFFKNSGTISSSAPVESNFNNIKNRIFRDKQLPLRIDDFICTHIKAIDGAVTLVNAGNIRVSQNCVKTEKTNTDHSIDEVVIDSKIIVTDNSSKDQEEKTAYVEINSEDKLEVEETRAVENWRGEGVAKPRRPRRSYLENQKEWKFIDLSEKNQIIPIAMLKNGNFTSLKPILIGNKKFVFTNTCSLDSLVQILAGSYCDSKKFKEAIDHLVDNALFTLCKKLVLGRITRQAYVFRGEILSRLFEGKSNPYDVVGISAVCTINLLLDKLMKKHYLDWCKVETSKCTNVTCSKNEIYNYCSLTITSDDLPYELNKVLSSRINFCDNCEERSLETNVIVNNKYLFVEWLLTSGEDRITKLMDIPQRLSITSNSVEYNLTGVIEILGCKNVPNNDGHFIAYVQRLNGKWEIYNDLKERVETKCLPDRAVRCAMLVYINC